MNRVEKGGLGGWGGVRVWDVKKASQTLYLFIKVKTFNHRKTCQFQTNLFSLSLSFKVKIGNNILFCCFVQGLGGAVSGGSCQHRNGGDTVYEQRPTHGLHVNSCDSLTVSKSAANRKKLIRLTTF